MALAVNTSSEPCKDASFLGEDLQVCLQKIIRSMFSLYRVYFLIAGLSTGQHSTITNFFASLGKGSV